METKIFKKAEEAYAKYESLNNEMRLFWEKHSKSDSFQELFTTSFCKRSVDLTEEISVDIRELVSITNDYNRNEILPIINKLEDVFIFTKNSYQIYYRSYPWKHL